MKQSCPGLTSELSAQHHIIHVPDNHDATNTAPGAPLEGYSSLTGAGGSEDSRYSQHHLVGRNASPSRASLRSTSSNITTSTTSASVPHLRRKHGHKHMRQHLDAGRDLFSSADVTSTADTSRPVNNHPVISSSRPSLAHIARSNTAPSPKRAPASHSSYGIETTAGPPPSFDTRRTLSTERIWKVERSKSLRMTLAESRAEAQHQSAPSETAESDTELITAPVTPLLVDSSPNTAETESVPTPTDGAEVLVMDGRSEQGLGLSNSETGSGSKTSSESHKSEDLFLNIARVNTGRPSSSEGEQRKSRISLPFMSSARPSSSHSPDLPQLQADSAVATPRAERPAYQSKRSSLQFGQLRGNYQAADYDTASNSGTYNNRFSTMTTDTVRPYARSSAGARSSRLVSESAYVDKNKYVEQNATESTASTTAPSTVWDELDDLKSRIKKLELTGKLPPSSAAAMSQAERPRTATTAATAATTMSSSPKHNKIASQLQSTIEGVPATVHPLLHEALGNAKAIVSHDVYQKLLATAQDALQLATMTSLENQGMRGATIGSSDRQMRRRTESMCRNLTELAIAMAAESKASQATRPGSRDHYISPAAGFRTRTYSQSNNELSDRPPVTTRVQSRLESRRTSAQHGYLSARHTSPDLESPTALPQFSNSGVRTTRIPAQLRNRRTTFLDGANDEDEPSPTTRPVSRAMTDLATTRRISRDHTNASREYTSQHPMPLTRVDSSGSARTPLPANLSTNFTTRRKYPSPASQAPISDSSPLAPRQSFGRISVVAQDSPSDNVSEAPGSSSSVRTRRSLGFASRIGSSVGNRLRAARAERIESRSYKEQPQNMSNNDLIGSEATRA